MAIKWYIEFIVQDFKQPIFCSIPAILFSVCIVVGIDMLCKKLNGCKICNKIPLTFFVAYTFVVLYTVFFSREPGSRKNISLVLFETWGQSSYMHAFFIENIMMFIPFGILLPIVFKRFKNGWLCVVAGFICSCSIEIMQYITQRGFLQLDDVVTNTTGTLFGWIIWRIIYVYYIKTK